jgi:hypothetical protein
LVGLPTPVTAFWELHMKRIHRASAVLFALIGALAFGLSGCGSDVAPSAPKVAEAPDTLAADLLGLDLGELDDFLEGTVGELGGTVSDLLTSLSLVTCETPTYGTVTQTVGPSGGIIRVGPHALLIPPGALAEPVAITARTIGGKNVKVKFAPAGLEFERSAILVLSYAHCSDRPTKPRIVYVADDDLDILEAIPSLNDPWRRRIFGKLDHFSGYAFAD